MRWCKPRSSRPATIAPCRCGPPSSSPRTDTKEDGHEKQDCESRACRRWLGLHGKAYASLEPIYLGDDLYSKQPICEAAREAGGHFIVVCKPDSHPTLMEHLSGVEIDERVEIVKRGKQRFRHVYRWNVYRWMSDPPLRDGADAMRVNWLSIAIIDPKGNVTYRNSFVTDLPVDRGNVIEMAACGRPRWNVENEAFDTLKTKGYHLEHNFGHGKQNLAAVLVTLNLLAFACHTIADLADDLWQKARAKSHTRAGFFDRLKIITIFAVFASWTELLETLAFHKPTPRPPWTEMQNENRCDHPPRFDREIGKARFQPGLFVSSAAPRARALRRRVGRGT